MRVYACKNLRRCQHAHRTPIYSLVRDVIASRFYLFQTSCNIETVTCQPCSQKHPYRSLHSMTRMTLRYLFTYTGVNSHSLSRSTLCDINIDAWELMLPFYNDQLPLTFPAFETLLSINISTLSYFH